MPYIESICVAGKTIEISKYHTYKYKCKGEKRSPRTNTSTEAQEQINNRLGVRRLRALMNANFKDGDFLVTLTFEKALRPKDGKEAQMVAADFIKALRREFKKKNQVLKYIYTVEIGGKGAAHIHMLLPECDVKMIRKCWTCGRIDIAPLYSDGEYIKIANYFTKWINSTIKHDGMLWGKRWYPSLNLKRPEVHKRVISKSATYRTQIKSHNGYCLLNPTKSCPYKPGYYYVDKELTIEGVNKHGYGYFTYTLHYLGEEQPPGWTEGWTYDADS